MRPPCPPNDQLRAETAALRSDLAQRLTARVGSEPALVSQIAWLSLYRRTQASLPACHVYEPQIGVILQGSKQVRMGEEVFVYDESRFLLTTVDLPVSSCVIEASEAQPYLGMLVKLDLARVRQLILDYELQPPRVAPPRVAPPRVAPLRGMATGPATPALLNVFARLMDLLDRPDDIPVMSDLLMQELLYRLLRGEQGGRLWQLAMAGSQSQRIQKVIQWLKQHYVEPLRVEALAEMAAMSGSSLHHHFREITSMSPLQFQKQLRLHEARRLMLVEDLDAGSASFRVGYESPSQFSREYARQFGQPPKRDINQMRTAAEASLATA